MAIFKIRTNEKSEYSTKEIYVEMIKQIGDSACKVDEMVVCAENFTAEELFKEYGLTAEHVVEVIKRNLK